MLIEYKKKADAARFLDVTPRQIDYLLKTRQLRYKELGKVKFIKTKDLEDFKKTYVPKKNRKNKETEI